MLHRTSTLKHSSTKTTVDVLLVPRKDSSARSVTSFPSMQTTEPLSLPNQEPPVSTNHQGVMNPDSPMGKVDQEKGDTNLTPEINLSLREMYLFNNRADGEVSTLRHNDEISSDDHQRDVQHNVSDFKLGQHPTTAEPECYDNDNYHDGDDLYPPTDTPPHSLTINKSLISQSTIEDLLQTSNTPHSSRDDGNEANSYYNPPSDVTSTGVGNVTSDTQSDLTSHVSRAGGGGHQRHNRKPSIYSAIGSLEDPLSSSFKGWEKDHNTHLRSGGGGTNEKSRKSNYEFPSMTTTLLAPQALGAAAKKKRILLESSAAMQTREVHTKPLKQPPRDVSPPKHSEVQSSSNSDNVNRNDDKYESVGVSTQDEKITEAKTRTKIEKKVTMDPSTDAVKTKMRKTSSRKQSNHHKNPIEMFRPSSDAYTPRMGKKEIKYKPAAMRTPVQQMASPLGTLSRPNFRDALRRVAMIIHQHIVKIERRFEQHYTLSQAEDASTTSSQPSQTTSTGGRGYGRRYHRYGKDDGLFSTAMRETFSEDRYITPRYKCTMVRVPMALAGMVYGLKHIREIYKIPTESEIYEFAHQLFKSVQLSSECSIVGLIYVERLMETAKVPLLADTWRPIFMCGLLMASKVWQDLSSWNIEFASVYPRYSLESINRLELQFLRMIKWDLYISSSQYAKYYFALRSLVEKPDFRQRYNRMVGGVDMVQASQARKIEVRSTMVKEEAILHLSRSM